MGITTESEDTILTISDAVTLINITSDSRDNNLNFFTRADPRKGMSDKISSTFNLSDFIQVTRNLWNAYLSFLELSTFFMGEAKHVEHEPSYPESNEFLLE